MKRLIWTGLAALCMAAPVLASAADGYVTGNVNMRAGPDIGYPTVVTLPGGTPVAIQGCTTDWAWCDVIAYDNRGWVAGNFIQYDYDNQPVLLPNYGARIGIPIVSFVIGSYWDAHYRNRSFYRQRQTWYHRSMPHRPPPRPLYNPRPMTNHAQPARPQQRSQPARPQQRSQPARPQQRSQPARPPQHSQPARPQQRSQSARPPQYTQHSQPARPQQRSQSARPPQHPASSKSTHGKGKPAPSSDKDDHGQH